MRSLVESLAGDIVEVVLLEEPGAHKSLADLEPRT